MRREIEQMHPIVIFLYLLGVVTITMLSLNPAMLISSFVMSFVIGVYFGGAKSIKSNIFLMIPIAIFTMLIQPLFSHQGTKVLFYINESAVYVESYVYGAVMFVLLTAVLQWFVVMHRLIDSEKMLYLFGKMAPTLGMIFSMILRFVPLLRKRYREIHDGQIGMGRGISRKGLKAVKYRLKEFSILVSWSLESSMETSASMESRGYGLKGRTSYHRFRFLIRDFVAIIFITGVTIYSIVSIMLGTMKVFYLPKIYIYEYGIKQLSVVTAFVLLAAFPLIIELLYIIKMPLNKSDTSKRKEVA